MLAKFIIVLFFLANLFCLGSALYYMLSRRRGRALNMVKALTFRIILSISLVVLLFIFFLTGILKPHDMCVNDRCRAHADANFNHLIND